MAPNVGGTFIEIPGYIHSNQIYFRSFEGHLINQSLTSKSKVDIFLLNYFQVAPNVGANLFEVTALDLFEFRKLHFSCSFCNI